MRFDQKGQALLIVILVMTVALTVGLSVATRTITNLRTTAEEENSQRAFSAAEAGIEQSLQNSTNSSGSFSNNSTYQTTVATLAGQDIMLNNGATVLKDDAVDLWLSTYPNYTSQWSGSLTIYWGSSSDVCDTDETINSMAALEVALIHGTVTNPILTRYAFDPCNGTPDRAAANNFDAPIPTTRSILGREFAYQTTIPIDPGSPGIIMRIVPLYAPTVIAVRGCDGSNANCTSLPVQGRLVTSVGVSENTQRKLVGFQEYPKLPVQIFPNLLFSPK